MVKSIVSDPLGFNADPDPAAYHNEDPDRIRIQGAKPMRIQVDPNPSQTSHHHKKFDFDMKYLKLRMCYVGTKLF